jgi:CelD/BcsL family acetyltransferase involved in cellulose biosynthesis
MAGPLPLSIDIQPVTNFTGLAEGWRELEGRAKGSFFQSWNWMGCLAGERFSDPWLLSARRGERLVGLGLFNRGPPRFGVGRPLLLGESGDAAHDSIFIEHNNLLLDATEPADLARQCWSALDANELGRARWILSGVEQTVCDCIPVRRRIRVKTRRPAPCLNFPASGQAAGPLIDRFSANTRQQLRRSLRAWEKIGPLRLEIAASVDEAEAYLKGLKDLHQRSWTRRGKPGAFAEPFFERFHRTLIRQSWAARSIDLMRVAAGERIAGYLYNFIHQGWVASYQSGFDFSEDADRLRPGMICHLMAIEHYAAAGMCRYDFLGGESRYKRSFANAETELLWVEARPAVRGIFGGRA